MFRHKGQRRTYQHNIWLAALLCLTAGFVNVAGFLAFAVLTTNVTGHVAIFAEKIVLGDFMTARVVGLWMFLFFSGAFVSSLIIHSIFRNRHYSFVIPILSEVLILILVGSYGSQFNQSVIQTELFAGSLLFAMGMQNALVSVVSGSVVRTTHLTGMFTDLGIELAAIIEAKGEHYESLKDKIKLRLAIIFFFFFGGILGGFLFKEIHYLTFYVPAAILLVALFYDVYYVRVIRRIRWWLRSMRQPKTTK
jgi:uncharacterized membrane protein YoaK (UPF0700 family)